MEIKVERYIGKPVVDDKSERASIVRQFVEEINAERVGTKWGQVTGKGIAMKLSHIKTNFDLYYFLSECRSYKRRKGAFSKFFFGSLKVR